jgi:prevent-host-death family protein
VGREITQRELRNESGEIMRALDRGESFVVTRNGVPVGELTPLRQRQFVAELVHVTAVEVVGDHRLRLTFEDGAEGGVDLSSWRWRGVFEPLADPSYFRQVTLDEELGTIVWPNGADIAPETLHAWVARGLKPAPT